MPFSLGENGFGTLSSVYTITGTALETKNRHTGKRHTNTPPDCGSL
jgi:hypothetical protein